MDEELQRLCDFFQRLNKEEKYNTDDEEQLLEEDVSLENVEKFDDFIRKNGGHTGGWNALEHSAFLKLFRKEPRLGRIIHSLRTNFPDISEDDIIQHNAWYKNYIALKSKQERALRYWKMNRVGKEQIEKKDTFDSAKVKVQRRVDDNVRLKILKWREDKRRLHEAALQQQRDKQRRKEEREKLRRITFENKKKMISEYKFEKQGLETAFKIAQQIEKEEQQKEKSRRANEMLKKYRKKDTKLIQNAQLKKLSKIQTEQQRRALIELIAEKSRKNLRVKRDPVRLLVPTIEWKQKIKSINFTDASSTTFPNEPVTITNVQRLGRPTWRKTLTENSHSIITNSEE